MSNESVPYDPAGPASESVDALVPPAQLTATPRPLTRRARRRSWNELPVRIWVILTLAVALITLAFAIDKYLSGRYQRWLIAEGQPVTAEVWRILGTTDRRQEFRRTDKLQVQLRYTVNGKQYELQDWEQISLAQLPDQTPVPTIRPGDTIQIRVDPDNPRVFTDRTEPLPWLAEFTVTIFLLPLLAFLAVVALVRRRRVLNIWRRGEVSPGIVVELKQTPVAPRSRVVRFTLAEGDDRRIFSTLFPAALAPRGGDVIWLIHPPQKPSQAIAAQLYVEQ